MRDLEIRGAGNLLGKAQSGHIAAVGFEMYCKLLKDSVSRLERKSQDDKISVHLVIDFMPLGLDAGNNECACIPPDYIESEHLRMEFYKKGSSLYQLKQIKDFELEMRDRFGALPPQLKNYFHYITIKVTAHKAGVYTVKVRDNRLLMEDKDGFRKINGKIPLLTAISTSARLKEIVKLVKSSR